jgi:hypothetical protein
MADKLGEFLAGHDWKLLESIKGWRVERDADNPDVVRFALPARDEERFIVRCICDSYPEEAPRVAFVNASGSAADRSAWPAGDDEFHKVVKLPAACFLCTDLTREGFEHHPDWKNRSNAWRGSTRTLMDLFNYLHDLLNSIHYQGRAK